MAVRPFSPKRAILKFSNLFVGGKGRGHRRTNERKKGRRRRRTSLSIRSINQSINHHYYHHHHHHHLHCHCYPRLPQSSKIIAVRARACPGTRQHSTAITVTVTNGAPQPPAPAGYIARLLPIRRRSRRCCRSGCTRYMRFCPVQHSSLYTTSRQWHEALPVPRQVPRPSPTQKRHRPWRVEILHWYIGNWHWELARTGPVCVPQLRKYLAERYSTSVGLFCLRPSALLPCRAPFAAGLGCSFSPVAFRSSKLGVPGPDCSGIIGPSGCFGGEGGGGGCHTTELRRCTEPYLTHPIPYQTRRGSLIWSPGWVQSSAGCWVLGA